jgi:hypothetical protein
MRIEFTVPDLSMMPLWVWIAIGSVLWYALAAPIVRVAFGPVDELDEVGQLQRIFAWFFSPFLAVVVVVNLFLWVMSFGVVPHWWHTKDHSGRVVSACLVLVTISVGGLLVTLPLDERVARERAFPSITKTRASE